MNKLVRCIDKGFYRLTVGKTYTARKYDKNNLRSGYFDYYIINDRGYGHGVEKELFIDVQEERIRKLKELGI